MMTSDHDKLCDYPTAAPPTPPLQFDRVDFSVFDSSREGNSPKRARYCDSKLSDEELAESLVMPSSSGEDFTPSAVFSSCPGNIASITGATPATEPSTENENNLIITITTPVRGTAGTVDVEKPIEISFPRPAKAGRSYKCSICGKVFSSHQALGGHKTSHRVKLPPQVIATENKTSSAVPTASKESAPNTGRKLHQCSICQKTFTSGQALGGHKRLHYNGVTSAKSVVTSSNSGSAATNSHVDGDGDSQKIPVLRDFDLNLSLRSSSPKLDLRLKLG